MEEGDWLQALRRSVEECYRSSMKLQIRNLESVQNDEIFSTIGLGGLCGGATPASALPQHCLPPRISLRISISAAHMGFMVCRIKHAK